MSFARISPRGDAITVDGKIDKRLRSNRALSHFARRLIVERLEDRRLLAVLFSHDTDDTVRAISPSESVYNNFGLDWIGGSEPFDDSAWQITSGTANGVGYDRGNAYDTLLGLDLESSMHGARSTLFARAEFNVADPSAVDRLTFSLRYDDGFIAWINGIEVARANADSVYPAWSATATAEHQASTTEFETFDLASAIASLQPGTNVFVIRGLNSNASDDDALIQFTLVGESRTGPPLAVNDAATAQENTPVIIDVLANDEEGSDPIDPSSVAIATPPAHGTAVANSDGKITYTPTTAYNGPDSFTYTVRDNTGTGATISQTLVASNAAVRAFVPANNNLGTTWRGADEPFNDTGWQSGTLGVGYDTNTSGTNFNPFIGLNVAGTLQNVNTTVYMRTTFSVADRDDVLSLTLRMRYDDGFVAFINGVQVASAFAPTSLSYNSASAGDTRPDADALAFQTFNLSAFLTALRTGANVLAIHGLNQSLGSSDLLMQPELVAMVDAGGRQSNAATVTVNVTGVDFPPIARDDAYSVAEGQTLEATTSSGGGPTTSTIVPANSTWLFRDDGIVPPNDAQGDTWKQTAYDDSGWASGPAQLGYGDADEGTVVNCGPSRPSCNSNNHITTWFRKHFTLEPGVAARATAMIIELMRDDAAAVYVNGVEVIRSNLPGVLGDNAVMPQTLASAVATTADESTFLPPETRDLTSQPYRNLLRDGDNVIAVEVHQNDPNSSDVTFDLRMSLTVAVSGGVLGNDTEPDGQAMTAVLGVGPVHGTLDFYPNGTFTYTPDPLYYGPDAFTYRATDGTLLSAEATVAIDVRHLPPVAVADSFALDEDTPLSIDAAGGVLANDNDTQNHTLSAQLIATTLHGVLALAADGSFSYVPDENFHGSDEFIYRASDGQLQSTPVTVTITVRSIDDPSVAANDTYEVSSGGTLTVDFPRSLGGPIPGGSRATPLAAGGQMIYDRHRDILYRIGSGTIQRYHVLTNTLLAPYSVPTTVTEGDISPDGRALYFADTATGPGIGYIRKISLEDGALTTLTYSRGGSEASGHDLAIGANGIGRFSTAYSGSGPTPLRRLDTATDTISGGGEAWQRTDIHSGPDKSLLVFINTQISSTPISTVDGITGSSIAGREFFQNADGGVAAISRNGQLVAFNCCNAGLNIRDRNLNLVRDVPDISNSVAFDAARDIFYAIDGGADQLIAFDTATWVELYRVPTGINPSSYGKLLTSANGQFAFVQTNNGVHQIDILNAPQVIVQAGSQWKYLDNGSDQGTAWREPGFNDYFWPTGRAQFGFGDGDEVTGVSYGDNASAKHATTYFRRTFQVDDPTALEDVTLSLLADDGAAVYLNGVAIARRNLSSQASHTTFAITAVDGVAESQYFDFAVDPALLRQGENVLAVEVHIRSAADDDMSFDLRLTANAPRPAGVLSNDTDGDGESLTAQLATGPQFGTLTLNPNGTFTYHSNSGFAGADTFTYRAVTASGQSEPATVTIDVGAVTGRPNINSFAYTAVEDEPLAVAAPGLLAGATDAEGGPLTSALTGPPLHGVVSIAADGSFVYTPEPGFNGQDAFIFAASDGSETSNRGIVTITVAARGDVPVAVDDEYTIDRGSSLVFAAPATSPETIAQTSFTEPATNSVSYTGGAELGFTASTTPSATELGVLASDQYIVRGINAPLTLSFSPVDLTGHRQVAVRIAVRAHEDSTGSDFEDTDYFRAHLGLARIGGPVVLQTIVDLNGAELKAIDNGLAGAFTTYIANIPDGFLTATLTIETLVDSTTERVFFDDISFSGVSLTGGNLLLANDTDEDGDELTVRIVSQPSHGSLETDEDGAMVYRPAPSFVGDDSFTYVANDGTSDSNVATVTIHVLLANLVPTAANDSYSINEDEKLIASVANGLLANDTDLDGDLLTIRVVEEPAHGSLSTLPNGAFHYTPAANYAGPDSFKYVASDGRDDSAAATVSIAVAAVNDAPTTNRDVYSIDTDETLDATAAATQAYRDLVMASNPMGYWRFGESSTSEPVRDEIANRHGQYVGGVTVGQPGAIGDGNSSARFDATSGYVNVPNSSVFNLANNFSVEGWIKPNSVGDYRRIAAFEQIGNGWAFGTRDSRLVFTTTGELDYYSPSNLVKVGEWQHIVAVFNASNDVTFYLNGSLVGQVAGSAPARSSNGSLHLGGEPIGSQFSDSFVDDIAIYNRVLDSAEIAEHYAAAMPTVADSVAEFSGTQGQDGWFYGYYNRTTDGDGVYQPANFTQFPRGAGAWSAANFWDAASNRWKWFNGSPPWTEILPSLVHPNGTNSGQEHWVVRRWVSDFTGPVVISGHLAKDNAGGGDGVRGLVYVNGAIVYDRVIGGADSVGVDFEVNATLTSGTIVDFVLTPNGGDFADGTRFTSQIRSGSLSTTVEGVLARNSVWKYRDGIVNGSAYPSDAQGDRWNERDYDDAAWASGPGILGFGGIDAGPIRTTIRIGPDGGGISRTALFRRTFEIENPDRIALLTLESLIDDGAAIYINGREVVRYNLPGTLGDGTLRTDSLAPTTLNEASYNVFNLDLAAFPGLLMAGTNTIAVEVHQINDTSSDLGFDLSIAAKVLPDPVASGVLGNDRDAEGDAMTAALVAGPYHGVLDFASDGTFTYTPSAGFEGVDQFTYRANDGTLDSALALVTINVGNANLAPLAADDRFVARSGTALSVAAATGLLANDFDPNGDMLSTTVFAMPTRGTLSLAADGSFVYTPSGGFLGVDSFTYRVADDNGTFGFATATIHVVPKIDPINGIPLAADDVFAVTANAVLSVSAPGVLTNDRDPELRPLVAVVEQSPWHGSLSFAADGSFTYTPSAGFTGADAFTYRAIDGNTFSAPATVVLNVSPAIPAGGVSPPLPPSSTPTGSTQLPGTFPLSGDLNGDGRVDRADLAIVVGAYGATAGSIAYSAFADLNADGRISIADAIAMRNRMSNLLSPGSSKALVRRANDRFADVPSPVDAIAKARLLRTTDAGLSASDKSPLSVARLNQPRSATAHRSSNLRTAAIDQALASHADLATALSARRTRTHGPRST